MPNLVSLGVEFLIAKLYVNSYLALLNARYYLQPDDTEVAEISEFRAHRPSLHSRGLEVDELQESRKNVFKHPDGHDGLYPTRPAQDVIVGTVDGRA
ncbi:hypothetical protein AZE42_04642 [Rhizopogon vesiculosus]|uniref:Uncharacterized protein n=1 Tax=Rhizopogon vesiculosus TaxID=180088 RepID=A0A1J8PQ02_9AGAM|nr:hypothetical protein AZE42_04642 [Rhizopogon vesiculosus]